MLGSPKKYMAGSVPRSLRQTNLSHLPFSAIVGSYHVPDAGGNNMVYDVIMLPPPAFQRARTNMGLRHVMAPAFKADASFQPGFVIRDTKEVLVPAGVDDPEAYARQHFIRLFGLNAWGEGAPSPVESEQAHVETEMAPGVFEEDSTDPDQPVTKQFSEAARTCTLKSYD